MAAQGGLSFDWAWDEASMESLRHKLSDKRTRVGKMVQFTAQPVERFIGDFGIKVAREVRAAAPKDKGRLRKGIEFRWSRTAGGEVIGKAPHTLWVDLGTSPHWPPMSAIAGWARRKGIPPFLVARKIALEGTPAVRFFQQGYGVALGRLPQMFQRLGASVEMEWGS